MSMTLRPITAADEPRWRSLYAGYCEFYKTALTDEKAATVWGWLHDPAHVVEGRVVTLGDEVVGLCHFRAFPVPLDGADGGFLDDLFVSPEYRGRGVASFALKELIALTRERGWVCLQWLTAEENARARSVYDQLARRTRWLTYEAEL